MTNPRVLLYCPVMDKPRPETAKAIKRLMFDGTITIEYGRENPYGVGDYRNVLAQYQRAWVLALEGGYDALFTIEHDIIPPSDALDKLWKAGAPVAYGLYRFRTTNVVNFYRYTRGRAPDQSYSTYPADWERVKDEEVIPVSGVGFGCTLIRSSVLRDVTPRAIDESGLSVDIAFATDCMAKRIKQVGVPGVVCGHVHDGVTLWPFDGLSAIVKVRALQNVNVFAGSATLSMKRGNVYEIEQAAIDDLTRAGFVQVVK